MRRVTTVVFLMLLSVSCRELSLPQLKEPQPGRLYGRLVYSKPGLTTPLAAAGAKVKLLSTSLSATADADGRFDLRDIRQTEGTVLFQLDADGDGRPERQRLETLESLKAGFNLETSVGELSLGENARLEGVVLLSDVPGAQGHRGSQLFVPQGPFTTLTADDGSFVLEGMPTGTVQVGVFHAGYRSVVLQSINLRAGEAVTLNDVVLRPQTVTTPGRIVGTVTAPAGEALVGAAVLAQNSTGALVTGAVSPDGPLEVSSVPEGLYTVFVSRAGLVPAVVNNVLVQAGATHDLGVVTLRALAPGEVVPDAGIGTGAGGGSGNSGGGSGGNAGGGAGGSAGGGSGGNTGGGSGGSAGGGSGGNAGGGAGGSAGGGIGGGSGGTVGVSDAGLIAYAGAVGFVGIGQTYRLDGGAASPTGMPVRFDWTQDAGEPVVLSTNNSFFASQPQFTAPSTAQLLRFTLTVSDGMGRTSAPAQTEVEVLGRPQARTNQIAIAVAVNGTFSIGAQANNTPSSLPVDFRWTTPMGGVSLASGAGTANATFNAGSMPGAFVVRLVVANPYIASTPIDVPVTVFTTPPAVTVNAGSTQTVATQANVQLSCSATAASQDTFTLTWTQLSGPTVSLSSMNSFTAPAVVSTLVFRCTAATPDGRSGFADVAVSVEDRTPPVVINNSFTSLPDGGLESSWLRATVTFDEPLNPSSVTNSSICLRSFSCASVARYVPGSTVVELYANVSMSPVINWELYVGPIEDLSPAHNRHVDTTTRFTPRAPRLRRWDTTLANASSIAPEPGVAMASDGPVVFAYADAGTGLGLVAYRPNLMTGELERVSSMPLPVSVPVAFGGRRMVTAAGAVFGVATGWNMPSDGLTLARWNGSAVVPFTNPTNAYSTTLAGGSRLRILRTQFVTSVYSYEHSDGGWAVDTLFGGADDPAHVLAEGDGGRLLFARNESTGTSQARFLTAYNRPTATSAFGLMTNGPVTNAGALTGSLLRSGLDVMAVADIEMQPRVGFDVNGRAWAIANQRIGSTSRLLSWLSEVNTSWSLCSNAVIAGHQALAFDAVGRINGIVSAYVHRDATSRKLVMVEVPTGGACSQRFLPSGPPASYLNVDLQRDVGRVELAATDDAIWVVWDEQLSSDAAYWGVHLLRLD